MAHRCGAPAPLSHAAGAPGRAEDARPRLEPPAVASFLVHGFRVTDDAVPATLIDLAARNVVDIEERGPGVFYVRLRAPGDVPLTAYERRVLDHLRQNARDGAARTGRHQSARWRRGFVAEVVADCPGARAVARRRRQPRLRRAHRRVCDPGCARRCGLGARRGRSRGRRRDRASLGWIKGPNPQRETPEGMEAASRWLSVRAELAENPVFATHSPLTVELWDRLLATCCSGVAARRQTKTKKRESRQRRDARESDEREHERERPRESDPRERAARARESTETVVALIAGLASWSAAGSCCTSELRRFSTPARSARSR